MRYGALFVCMTAVACAQGEGSGSDAACVLGTADHCGSCATACPGADTASTQRTCTTATATGTCTITCKGESYDLDANLTNGCEAEDLPVQSASTTAVAVTLPNATGGTGACNGSTNPCTQTGQIYGDNRVHDTAPVDRPLGREDWYRVTATGAGAAGTMGACLGITNFPADNQFEVCIGDSLSPTPTSCMTAIGGAASVCVQPPTAADAGTFYVRIRKITGTNTPNQYALYLTH